MYKQIRHIPLRNPCIVKYINDAISRNSGRVRVQNPAKTGVFKKIGWLSTREISIGGHPDIFRPHHDCGACGGNGCSRCS